MSPWMEFQTAAAIVNISIILMVIEQLSDRKRKRIENLILSHYVISLTFK